MSEKTQNFQKSLVTIYVLKILFVYFRTFLEKETFKNKKILTISNAINNMITPVIPGTENKHKKECSTNHTNSTSFIIALKPIP